METRAMAKLPAGVGPKLPQVVVLFGATGDLSRRKLLPGLFHLFAGGFIPDCRIVGVSLDDIDAEGFRAIAKQALATYRRGGSGEDGWPAFAGLLDYVPLAAGAAGLKEAVERSAKSFGRECRLMHYLSVPPSAALKAVQMLSESDLARGSRIKIGRA